MAEALSALGDPLLQLRQSIASFTPPIPTATLSADSPTEDLSLATYLTFTSPTTASYPLSTSTRFISSNDAVDLRSIYFAWQHKDDPIPDYIASAQALNDALASSENNASARVRNLVFVERLDLITWLEGSSDDSEYIKRLDPDSAAAQAAGSVQVASGAAGGAAAIPNGAPGGRPTRAIDPRLQKIYKNERSMGNRNTVLRGVKPIVRSTFPPITHKGQVPYSHRPWN